MIQETTNGLLRACCAEHANLERSKALSARDLEVRLCRVCGRRHFTWVLSPGRYESLLGRGSPPETQ